MPGARLCEPNPSPSRPWEGGAVPELNLADALLVEEAKVVTRLL